MSEDPSIVIDPSPKKNYNWVWFFLFLVVGTAAAVTTMIVYNLNQQLTQEQLSAAWELWKEKGPKNYDLVYSKKLTGNEKPERLFIKVRNGFVEDAKYLDEATPTEKQFGLPPKVRRPAEHSWHHLDISGMFGDIQKFMDEDQKKEGRKPFVRAIFHADDGHIQWYVRRVMGSRERVEIIVEKFTPLSDS